MSNVCESNYLIITVNKKSELTLEIWARYIVSAVLGVALGRLGV
jgi:hypothetical protein